MSFCAEAEDLSDLFSRATQALPLLLPCDLSCAVNTEITDTASDLYKTRGYSRPKPGDLRLRLFPSRPDKTAMDAYRDRYFFMDYAMLHVRPGHPFHQYDWKERRFSRLEFAQDFVLPIVRARMTMGFSCFAEDGLGRAGLTMTRSTNTGLSDRERSTLIALAPQFGNLYNLHRRLEKRSFEHINAAELALGRKPLSPQEARVAELIVKRLRPAEIATLLLISRRTVERHIEHIYGKLRVSCRRDMLRSLLGFEATKACPGHEPWTAASAAPVLIR